MRKDNNSRTRRSTGRQFRCVPLPPVSFDVILMEIDYDKEKIYQTSKEET